MTLWLFLCLCPHVAASVAGPVPATLRRPLHPRVRAAAAPRALPPPGAAPLPRRPPGTSAPPGAPRGGTVRPLPPVAAESLRRAALPLPGAARAAEPRPRGPRPAAAMPLENLEEEGLPKNPDLRIAQLRFLLSLRPRAPDPAARDELMAAVRLHSEWGLGEAVWACGICLSVRPPRLPPCGRETQEN